MNPRLLAGLGMALLAAGLLTIFVLQDGESGLSSWTGPENEFGIPEVPLVEGEGPAEVQRFLERHGAGLQERWTEAHNLAWLAAAESTPENMAAADAAMRRLDDYRGSAGLIDQLKLFRGRLDLSAGQDRQVEMAWQDAARFPGTHPEAVNRLRATQAALADTLADFVSPLPSAASGPTQATLADLDAILLTSGDPSQLRAAWEARQQVGPLLKDGLVTLRETRNELAGEMGYSSYFALQAAGYELGSADLLALMDDLLVGIMPLYTQLHCWARHELAARFGVENVPHFLPVHWLGDFRGGRWPTLRTASDRDALFRDVQPQWVIEQAEGFYTSLGLPSLPVSFWTRSELFSADATGGQAGSRGTGPRGAAWHMDLDRDVRAMMSLSPTFESFTRSHEVLGQVYYFLAYSRPEVPVLLRRGANRAFPAAMGHLATLAADQTPYLQQLGVLPLGEAAAANPAPAETTAAATPVTVIGQPDLVADLLDQALAGPVVLLPLVCGTMAHWEHDLYERQLPRHQFNTRWWQYAARYQGIASPQERGEDHCDPATLPDILAPGGSGYDRALAAIIAHQLHRYICREILDQDVRAANYHGNPRVGRYLQSILELGATRDWAVVMRQATGEDLSCDALVEYYAPLQNWLAEQNAGREVGF